MRARRANRWQSLAEGTHPSRRLSLLSECVTANCSVTLSVFTDEGETDLGPTRPATDRRSRPVAGGVARAGRGERPARHQRADGVAPARAVPGAGSRRDRPWQPRAGLAATPRGDHPGADRRSRPDQVSGRQRQPSGPAAGRGRGDRRRSLLAPAPAPTGGCRHDSDPPLGPLPEPARADAPSGLLVQIDGSPHDWLEGRGPRLCLVGAIDDATGAIVAATFCKTEDGLAYLTILAAMCRTHGIPAAVYRDRSGIFAPTRRAGPAG